MNTHQNEFVDNSLWNRWRMQYNQNATKCNMFMASLFGRLVYRIGNRNLCVCVRIFEAHTNILSTAYCTDTVIALNIDCDAVAATATVTAMPKAQEYFLFIFVGGYIGVVGWYISTVSSKCSTSEYASSGLLQAQHMTTRTENKTLILLHLAVFFRSILLLAGVLADFDSQRNASRTEVEFREQLLLFAVTIISIRIRCFVCSCVWVRMEIN